MALSELDQRPGRVRRAAPRWPVRPSADPEYLDGQRRVAPGIGDAVRRSLAAAGGGPARVPARHEADPPDPAPLRRRSPLPRAGARDALVRLRPPRPNARGRGRTDLAAPATSRPRGRRLDHGRLARPPVSPRGIAREPYRWAELEQLVYSPSRWERRLVGSTIATMTHAGRRARRDPDLAGTGVAAPRAADRRRRTGRAEGAQLGLSIARGRSTWRRRPAALESETTTAVDAPTTVIAPG